MPLINKKGNNNIIVDMENVRYCDSSGLSALLTGHRFCREAGSVFLLNALQTNVKKMVVISRLDTVFTIKNTMKEALDFLFVEEIERKLGNK